MPRYGHWTLAPVPGDEAPPSDVSIDVVVDRASSLREFYEGCQCGGSCPDLSYLVFVPSATDDQSAPEHIGYRFSHVAGNLPASLSTALSPNRTYVVNDDHVIGFDIDRDEELWFTVEVVAVDESGNESAPIRIVIDD